MTSTHNSQPGALSCGSRNTDDSGLVLRRLRLTNMDKTLSDILFCSGGFWCVHVSYAFARVCVSVHGHMHMWRSEVDNRCPFQLLATLIYETGSLV